MPTTLLLIRHGQTLHNVAGKVAGWTDSPLSEIGLEQAERLADYVSSQFALDGLYSSPLQRALLTAEAIGRRCGLAPAVRDDLKELNFGVLENLTEAEISAFHPGIWAASQVLDDHSFTWPGGESRAGFYARVRRVFRDIAASHPGETVAVVSHGGVLGSYVAELLEEMPQLWRKYLVKNCSVTSVEVSNGRSVITCFDDHSFLPVLGPDPLLESLATATTEDD